MRPPAVPAIFICLALWIAGFVYATSSLLDAPYLGARFGPKTSGGAVVEMTMPGGPVATSGLAAGDTVISLSLPEGTDRHRLSDLSGKSDRSQTSSHREWTGVDAEKRAIWRFMTGPSVFETADGRRFEIDPEASRGWRHLPVMYWVNAFHSFIILAIGAGFFAFAPASNAVNLVALSGFFLAANLLGHAIKTSIELALPPDLWTFLYFLGNGSAVLFAYALLALLWHTPRAPARFPFASVALGFAVFAFLAQHFDWLSFPLHQFQFPYFLAMVIAVVLATYKWISFRGQPVERAALSWVLISILISVLPWSLLYSIPIAVMGSPIIDADFSGAILTVTFVCFAFAALRYRLFAMQRIWLRSLVWICVGVVFLLVDVVLLTFFDWESYQAIPGALLLASWAYFPVKNLVFSYFINRRGPSLQEATDGLFEHIGPVSDPALINGRFVGFLKSILHPLRVELQPDRKLTEARIDDNGLSLSLPALGGDATVVLRGRDNGRRLFSSDDLKLIGVLSTLAQRLRQQKEAEFNARTTVRTQIARDLHDTIGAKLLNLIYTLPESDAARESAEQAMQALKDSLLALEDEDELDLKAGWQNIWEEQEQRLRTAGFATKLTTRFSGSRIVNARIFINIKRILEEHISNVMKYADRSVTVEGDAGLDDSGAFKVEVTTGVCRDGSGQAGDGRGHINMLTRAREISADITLGPSQDAPQHFRFALHLPLGE